MAENAEDHGLGLGLKCLVAKGCGVDVLTGDIAGRLDGMLDRYFYSLLLDVARVAPADALGGAEPLAVLFGPGVLGLAPVMAERVKLLGPGLGLEGFVLEGCGVDVLAGGFAGRVGDVLDGSFHGLLLHVGGVALADALGGAVPAVVLLGPGVLGSIPVVFKRRGLLGFDLGLKALVRKVGGVGGLAGLGAGGGHGLDGGFYGLLDLPATVTAFGVAGAIPVIPPLLPDVDVLVDVVVVVLAVGVAVAFHLAAGPHELVVNVDVGAAGVVTRLTTKAKELRAGGVVTLCLGRAVGDVEDVLVVPHVVVVNVQRLLPEPARARVERAVVHVHGNVVLASAGIGVDVDNLAAGVKGAVVERHDGRAVRPEGVVAARGVERRVLEHCGLVAPVERLAVDDAAIEHGVVDANKAQIVSLCGAHRHILERNGASAVERVIAVVLSAVVIRVGNLGTNVPRSLVRAGTHEGEVLAFGVTHGAHAVEGVVARAELDGVAALRLGGSGGKIIVVYTGAGIGNRDGGNRAGDAVCNVCKSRRCNAHRDERNGKQRCDRTRDRFQK